MKPLVRTPELDHDDLELWTNDEGAGKAVRPNGTVSYSWYCPYIPIIKTELTPNSISTINKTGSCSE